MRMTGNAARHIRVDSQVWESTTKMKKRRTTHILSEDFPLAGVFLQPFVNLELLDLQIEYIHALPNLFKSSSTIHTIIINIINPRQYARKQWKKNLADLSNTTEEHFWASTSQDIEKFIHHVNVVKIHGFSECEGEICLVKFLLMCGRVLQEMVIYSAKWCRPCRDPIQGEKIRSQMIEFARASCNVKLAFE